MENLLLPILFTIAHIFNAIDNSAKDNAWLKSIARDPKGEKLWRDIFHYAQVAQLSMYGFVIILVQQGIVDYPSYWYLICWFLTRSVFDYVHNATRGLPLDHRGGSPIWDKLLIKIKMHEAYCFDYGGTFFC